MALVQPPWQQPRQMPVGIRCRTSQDRQKMASTGVAPPPVEGRVQNRPADVEPEQPSGRGVNASAIEPHHPSLVNAQLKFADYCISSRLGTGSCDSAEPNVTSSNWLYSAAGIGGGLSVYRGSALGWARRAVGWLHPARSPELPVWFCASSKSCIYLPPPVR